MLERQKGVIIDKPEKWKGMRAVSLIAAASGALALVAGIAVSFEMILRDSSLIFMEDGMPNFPLIISMIFVIGYFSIGGLVHLTGGLALLRRREWGRKMIADF